MITFIPDTVFIKLQYRWFMKKKLNLINPEALTEKIQWLKLYWRDPAWTICADKYKVRDYVRDRIGEGCLIPLLGVYERVEDIKLDILPDSFVLKVNHGTGQNIICKNKANVNWKNAFKKLNDYMQFNLYLYTREWGYKNIEPKIICEEYIADNGRSPDDYKIFCFNGEPRIIKVDSDRFNYHKINFFDLGWNVLPFGLKDYPRSKENIEKPNNLSKMIEYSRILSKDFLFVRVDFYNIKNRIYFGELTFTPGNGMHAYDPEEYDVILGSYLKLPTLKE